MSQTKTQLVEGFNINPSAPTDALVIDSDGRLLVGTSTAPTVGVSNDALFVVQGYEGVPTGDSLISLQRGQAPADISNGAQLGGITFGASDGSPYAQIHAATDGTGGTNDYPGRLVFSTTADSGTAPTERMRISANGNLTVDTDTFFVDAVNNRVGIGTTSPQTEFEINTSGPIIRLVDTDSPEAVGFIGVDPNGTFVRTFNTEVFRVMRASGNETLRADASGRLLVGTASTSNAYTSILAQGNASGANTDALLRLATENSTPGDGAGLGGVLFCASNHGDTAAIRAFRDGGTWTNDSSEPTRLTFSTTADGASSATERMRISANGNLTVDTDTLFVDAANDRVAIGHTSPNADFHVKRDASQANIAIFEANNSGGSLVCRTQSAGIGEAVINVYQGANTTTAVPLVITQAGSESLRIDSSGRLFVGLNSTPVNASLSTLTGGNSSTYAYVHIVGGSATTYKMLKAAGKFIVRGVAERNIDLVQAVQADGNMNILITVKFKLNSATSGESGEIYCQADMHATNSGNWNYDVKTPQKTQHFGSSYGVGSLAWVGGGTNDKILRYSTDSNSAYTSYMIEEIVITGYDNANTTLL